MKSSILIIYTGGTIGMKNDAETGACGVPAGTYGVCACLGCIRPAL